MKTKAEAIARPEVGDRWKKGDGVCRMDGRGGYWWDGPAKDAPPITNWHEPWWPRMKKWMESAEYLGGSNE